MNTSHLSGGQHAINRRRKPVVTQYYKSPARRAVPYQSTRKESTIHPGKKVVYKHFDFLWLCQVIACAFRRKEFLV
ncbi:MAG: hypothetical protein KBH01_02320 [Breznakibacter sp.]|nr:hypothetical protein [Breznakibacter sp.]